MEIMKEYSEWGFKTGVILPARFPEAYDQVKSHPVLTPATSLTGCVQGESRATCIIPV